jgi:hypothetical protein
VDPSTCDLLLVEDGVCWSDISARCRTIETEWDVVSTKVASDLGVALNRERILGEHKLVQSKCHVFVVALDHAALGSHSISKLHRIPALDLPTHRKRLHARLRFSYGWEMNRLIQFARSPVVHLGDLLNEEEGKALLEAR